MLIRVSTPVVETPRVMQIRGMFDLAPEATSSVEWEVHLPYHDKPWNIGLIVGPSGSGKSTIARHLWPNLHNSEQAWEPNRTILDAFPDKLGIKAIAEILSSVGFSSPPAWLRPFHVLSTGQKFRVTLARLIAEALSKNTGGLPENQEEKALSSITPPIVLDEYTSVVDRNVAKIGSAALAKTVRAKALQFVAVTCHEDVEEWLDPDWVYRPAERTFAWRSLRRRPPIDLQVFRCSPSAWGLFAPHHYLSQNILRSAWCFMATWQSTPVAFSAWAPFVSPGPPTRREHRTVTLPDFQGVGIGNAISSCIASMWKALGYKPISTTSHPAMMASRARSPLWTTNRMPKINRGIERKYKALKHATTRLTGGFEYIGPPMPKLQAKALLNHQKQ